MSTHDVEAEGAQAGLRPQNNSRALAAEVIRIKAEFATRKAAWMSTIRARLAEGPATTMQLAEACGCDGHGSFSTFLNARKRAGTLRVVGYVQGPTGFPNSLWEWARDNPDSQRRCES